MSSPNRHDYKVFISHSTHDKFMARKLDEMLRAAGVQTFRDDRDLDGGNKIPEEIRKEILTSHELLVVWSTQTLSSEWVKQEIGAAWVLGIPVVPLLHVVPPSSLPPTISDRKAYLVNDAERYVEEVLRRAEAATK